MTMEEYISQVQRQRQAADVAFIGLHTAILKDSMQRQRAALQSIVGIYEEQAARKQYDILGDGSV